MQSQWLMQTSIFASLTRIWCWERGYDVFLAVSGRREHDCRHCIAEPSYSDRQSEFAFSDVQSKDIGVRKVSVKLFNLNVSSIEMVHMLKVASLCTCVARAKQLPIRSFGCRFLPLIVDDDKIRSPCCSAGRQKSSSRCLSHAVRDHHS